MQIEPTGVVTFLFTDIEGSTKLSQEFPDLLHAHLEKHDSILKHAVESNSGFIFKIVGDAYCCAFHNAADAVNSAIDIQTALANEKWKDAVIRVRIGIHSGNAEWNGGDYMGYITLARVSRVMSAAYGEQILISDDACKLFLNHKDTKTIRKTILNDISDENTLSIRYSEAKEISFRDLGERRLKDVIEPIRLFQVVSKGLRDDFPPLKTLDARPNNLPVQLTNFIGREEEIKHAKDLLKNNRLLTLTGTGGAGKTRFSLQTGAELIDDFENGVWFAELAELSDPGFLPDTILNALCIKEKQNKTSEQTLTDHLKDKEILIILDNCEHLIHECAELTERLLMNCPKLKVIATSREALNIIGEQSYKIPPLTQPDPNSINTPEKLIQYESVRLFIERALAVNPKFRVNNENTTSLAEVCSRLDGIPLAIELAAARTKVLSVEKINERLNDRFKLLTGGKRTALPRQQTLKALIDWSYDLLSDNEKILWSRLSVFSGGWTMESAEEVCSDDTLSKYVILDLLSLLTEKSIIIYDETNERYRILESLKHYGEEKLKDGNEIFLKHLNYYSELSERAKPGIPGDNAKMWLDLLEADHYNFQSAIEWGVRNRNAERAARIASALGRFWNIRGYYTAAIKLLDLILDKSGELSKSAIALLLNWKGIYYKYLGKYEQAQKFFKDGLELRREIMDYQGVSSSLNSLGNITYFTGDYDQAQKYYEESLAIRRESKDKYGIAGSLGSLGNLAFYRGFYEKALEYFEESLIISRELGDKTLIAGLLFSSGGIALSGRNYEQAKKNYEESLVLYRETGDKHGIAESLNSLGIVSASCGDYEQALKYHEESLILSRKIEFKLAISISLGCLGTIAYNRRDYEEARKYKENSLEISRELGYKSLMATSLIFLSGIFLFNKNYHKAVKLLSAAETSLESLGEVLFNEDQKIKDEILAKLHENLSDQEFSKFREEGKIMSLEEACQLAINI